MRPLLSMSSSRLDGLGCDQLTRLATPRILPVLSEIVGIEEETMAIEVRSVHHEFVAEILGIELSRSVDRSVVDKIWGGDRPIRRAGVPRSASRG